MKMKRERRRARLTGGVGEEHRAGQRQEEEHRQLHGPCGRAPVPAGLTRRTAAVTGGRRPSRSGESAQFYRDHPRTCGGARALKAPEEGAAVRRGGGR